jgi:hypothetical protein
MGGDDLYLIVNYIGAIGALVLFVLHVFGHYPRATCTSGGATQPALIEFFFAYIVYGFALLWQLVQYVAQWHDQGDIVNPASHVVNWIRWVGQAGAATLLVAGFCAIAGGGAMYVFVNTLLVAFAYALLVAGALVSTSEFQTWSYVIIGAGVLVAHAVSLWVFDYSKRAVPDVWKAAVLVVHVAIGAMFVLGCEGLALWSSEKTQLALLICDLVKYLVYLVFYYLFVSWHNLREVRGMLVPFTDAEKDRLL